MTDEFNRVFGGKPAGPNFVDRLGGGDRAAATNTAEAAVGTGEYKAYGFMPSGVGEVCEVTRWIDGTEIPEGIEFQYRFLMQVGFVGEEQLRLMLPDCIVLIEGKNLRELRKRLARRMVTFITQFNPGIWTLPPHGEAYVDRIEVIRSSAGS